MAGIHFPNLFGSESHRDRKVFNHWKSGMRNCAALMKLLKKERTRLTETSTDEPKVAALLMRWVPVCISTRLRTSLTSAP